MSAKSKVYFGALLIFVFGAVSGGFGSAMYAHSASPFGCHRGHKERSPEKLTERLTQKLSLNPEQKGKVQEIFQRSFPEMKKLKDEQFEAKKAFRMKVGDEIRGFLNPDQQTKFDELKAKMQERMERKREGWGHGKDRED